MGDMDYEEGYRNDDDDSFPGYLDTMEQREREEMEFFTDLAVQEIQRWVEALTRKHFKYPDDPKRSLADGILLCELLNAIKPGSVKRINKLPTAMAGMDNLNVFIETCKKDFGLKAAQLFEPGDLQELAYKAKDREALDPHALKQVEEKKLRNVAIAIFWLARQVQGTHGGPDLDLTNFTALVNAKSLNSSGASRTAFHQRDGSEDLLDESLRHSRTSSRDSSDNMHRRYSSAVEGKEKGKALRQKESRYSSSDSLDDTLDDTGRSHSASAEHGLRRTSTAPLPAQNPLQFVALKPAVTLALKAEQTIELVQETKRQRDNIDKDQEEWQTNLSSWKQRRKSKGGSLPYDDELESESPRREERSRSGRGDGDVEPSYYAKQRASDQQVESDSEEHNSEDSEMSAENEGTTEFQPLPDCNESCAEVNEDLTMKTVELRGQAPLSSSDFRPSAAVRNKFKVKLETTKANDEGFGFSIKGGKDRCLPITIDSVITGSAADIAELLEGDEIIEINEEVVTDRNRGYCMLLINGSLQKNGCLDLYIKRDNKVSNLARERRKSSMAVPRTILDVYAAQEAKQLDQADGAMMCAITKDKIEEAMVADEEDNRRAMERHYRQILDGGYDSAASTLRSDLNEDSHDKGQLGSPLTDDDLIDERRTEFTQSPDQESKESHQLQEKQQKRSEFFGIGARQDMTSPVFSQQNFDDVQERVRQDFESVAPPKQTNIRLPKRSAIMDTESKRRMEEWQMEQDRIQQDRLQKEQREMQQQIEQTRKEAQEKERTRHEQREVERNANEPGMALSKLKVEISNVNEREAREKAVKRLQEIRERYNQQRDDNSHEPSRAALSPSRNSDADHEVDEVFKQVFSPNQKSELNRTTQEGMDVPQLSEKEKELKRREEELRKMAENLRLEQERLAEEQRKLQSVRYSGGGTVMQKEHSKPTPKLSEVYKYYEEESPSNLGERDPSPPPMSREDVMRMNKKAHPRNEPVETPEVRMREKAPAMPSGDKATAPWDRAEKQKANEDKRQSAPVKPHWMQEEKDDFRASKGSDVDPSMPTYLSKDDVLKMTREKARYGSTAKEEYKRRASTTQIYDSMAENDSHNKEDDVRNPKGFVSSRAMFEQQSREADRYWEEKQREPEKPIMKQVSKPVSSKPSLAREAPQKLQRENRSKSVDIRPTARHSEVVRGVEASNAQVERMRELQMLREQRDQEAREAEEEEDDRRNKERKIREERQRELAAIRQLNREYENDPQTQQDNASQLHREPSREEQLEVARRRMAQEAEKLARAQYLHDQEVKQVHGRDLQEERRKRELSHFTRQVGEELDEPMRDREMGEIDSFAGDNVSRKRHQEMLEQERRERERKQEERLTNDSRLYQKESEERVQQQHEQLAQRRQEAEENTRRQREAEENTRRQREAEENTRRQRESEERRQREAQEKIQKETEGRLKRETEERRQREAMERHQAEMRQKEAELRQKEVEAKRQREAEDLRRRKEADQSQRLGYHTPQGSWSASDGGSRNDSYRSQNGSYKPMNNRSQDVRPNYGDHAANQPYIDEPPPYSNGYNNNRYPPQTEYNSYNGGVSYSTLSGPTKPPRSNTEEELITVSAKYSCAYCSKELGKGAAMVIESLNLYYHIECFRCCVCHTLLSNGQMGADVRVRVNKLHCKNCYSNDEGRALSYM